MTVSGDGQTAAQAVYRSDLAGAVTLCVTGVAGNAVSQKLSPLAQALLTGDRARLAQIFRSASLQLDLSRLENAFQTGFFSRRLLAAAGMDGARNDLLP